MRRREPRQPTGIAWVFALAAGAVIGLFGCAGSGAIEPDLPDPPDGGEEDPYAWWEAERAARRDELDAYLAANPDGVHALLHEPLGDLGIPASIIPQLPVVFPDIWGTPEEKLAGVGLGPNLLEPSNPLPLGIATYEVAGVELANISCGACHVGRVIGPDGEVELLIGAPNTAFDAIFTAFEDTAADPRWDDLDGDVTYEIAKQALLLRRWVGEQTLGFTFDDARVPSSPDAFARGTPGYFDSFAVIFSMQLLPDLLNPLAPDDVVTEVMPAAPGEADIMSLWLQRDRPAAEWDGSLPHPVYRNLAAGVGAVAFGQVANLEAAIAASDLALDLPPPPYPFAVDARRAERGEALFEAHCASCHHAGADAIYPTAVTGTDPNRANVVTAEGRARLIEALRAGCDDDAACDAEDAEIVAEVAPPGERGYLALPLDGIWARAPYLHNGSVPTLRHLLVPSSRPATFVRGNLHYDTENVGFAWDPAAGAADAPHVHPYDTTRAGRHNTGHDGPDFLGLDWASRPSDLADLLEYLKTL